MIQEILYPLLVLGGMGLLFGAVLAYASQKFYVEVNPLQQKVRDALPGANDGGCGFASCDAYAQAVAEGRADINKCVVGGQAVAEALAAIMGTDAGTVKKRIARVMCKGTDNNAVKKYKYHGVKDCRAANALSGGDKECEFGCLGLGTCERVCPFDAIHVTAEGIAESDEEKCTGCGMCVDVCPKNVIQLIDISKRVIIFCNNHDKGKRVRQICKVGCIACSICVRQCPEKVITMDNDLAVINYDGCTNCGACIPRCPTKTILNLDEIISEVVAS
ncbi:RnfABCDGE type electron transport complex subunit B [Calorimonas adulescens]|uniref:RnfABCDGE type electron transport complex subunit B n=1 Tax=Calorimonas adulescens TaxID=2606906 RepID=UPI001EF0754B|nr:Fe-S cluster domain-containing protein [Calorimonas adulescens]